METMNCGGEDHQRKLAWADALRVPKKRKAEKMARSIDKMDARVEFSGGSTVAQSDGIDPRWQLVFERGPILCDRGGDDRALPSPSERDPHDRERDAVLWLVADWGNLLIARTQKQDRRRRAAAKEGLLLQPDGRCVAHQSWRCGEC